MADIKGPGGEGSTQGQIKTPMRSENVDNQGDPKVRSYEKATGKINKTGTAANSIEGPGANGNWDTQLSIKGTNKGKY